MERLFLSSALYLSLTLSVVAGAQHYKNKQNAITTRMDITREQWGVSNDGTPIDVFTLTNVQGMKIRVTNYGGIVTELRVPDRNGRFGDVVLGFDSLKPYLAGHPYFGCLVGRYANRIAGGNFVLDGVEYRLATNDGSNHLHGGTRGFDKAVWQAEPVRGTGEVGVKLSRVSKDGEEGYPGNLSVTVNYTLTNRNEFKISYAATTDKPTIINLTHHSYFNLAGAGKGDVLQHKMMINANRYTVVDTGLIPTGELRAVKGTPMDFMTPHAIGERIGLVPGGYDHNFVLKREGGGLSLAARVYEPHTGRVMEVWTTEPGLQFYSGNFLDGTITGKGDRVYRQHFGFCLETQHFPDSPHHPDFPPVVLLPGERYHHETTYRFSTRR